MTITDKPVTSHEPRWNFDMDAAPLGGKLLALNHGMCACFATLSNKNKHDFLAWCPLPKIPKEYK